MPSNIAKKLEVPHEAGTVPDRWINNDIKPIEAARRTWGFWAFHNLWVTTDINISTYLLGSSLIAIGLTWWQAIICIAVGAILTTLVVILNSTAGGFYHIGFPVANRYAWGMYGSQFVILNRILLSFVWYAVQGWIGGQCTYVCLQAIWPNIEDRIPNHMPESTGMTTANFVAYIIFSVISLPFIWIRPHKLQPFFWVVITIDLITWTSLLIWALATMGPEGFGSTITGEQTALSETPVWTMTFAIISTVSAGSAGILNQNDYARFARRPRDVVYGQLGACPFYLVFSAVIGILVTAATENRYGEALWNLPVLLSRIIEMGGSRSRVAAFFAAVGLTISQLAINITGNSLSGGFDLAATFPKYINIRRGGYITAIFSIVINPWQLLSSASIFLSVMSAYGVFLGPMVSLMVTSYYITFKQKINVDDLYIGNANSIYWYTFGINWRALVAWVCGVAPHMPGFIASVNPAVIVPVGCLRLYYINFLSGFAITSVVFIALHGTDRRVREFVNKPVSRKDTMQFYREKLESRESEEILGFETYSADMEGRDSAGVIKTLHRDRYEAIK